MDAAAIAMWLVAGVLLLLARRRAPDGVGPHLAQAVAYFIGLVPRLILAILISGFLGAIIPGAVIAAWIGQGSGVSGILVASVLGGIVPGGPIISFPIIVLLRDGGAGTAQIVAFLTAWSVLALHRVLIYETTLMGWRFSALRLASSLALAPLAGLATQTLLGLR